MGEAGSGLRDYWWRKPREFMHGALFDVIRALEKQAAADRETNIHHLRLYSNAAAEAMYGGEYSGTVNRDRIPLNVIKSVTDSVVARLATEDPKITVLTDDGDYFLQEKSKRLEKFAAGQFYSTDLYDTGLRVLRDACIFGTGILHIYEDPAEHGTICAERVFRDELLVDPIDAMYGRPRCIYRTKNIPRECAIEWWPKSADKLAVAGRLKETGHHDDRLSDTITVAEAWHLPTSKGANDGMHCVCADNVMLDSGPWEQTYFPFVFLHWGEPECGMWGHGISETHQASQAMLNKLVANAHESMNLNVPRIAIQRGSQVVKPQLVNMPWSVIEHTGPNAPQALVWPSIDPLILQEIDRLVARVYEFEGMSMLWAQAVKPVGLDSKPAQDTFNDTQSGRFMDKIKRYQGMYKDAAVQMFDLAAEIDERARKAGEDGYKVLAKDREGVEEIAWSDVADLDPKVVQVVPTNLLSTHPGARLEQALELKREQVISQEDFGELMPFPDVNAVLSRKNAPVQIIRKSLATMVRDGKFITPEPYDNLALDIKIGIEFYHLARLKNVPEAKLALIRQYIDYAKDELAKQATPPMAPMGAAPPQPMGLDPAALGPEQMMPTAIA